jgi:hypothetical protein
MADNETAVIGGVDCHLDTHHAVALDQHLAAGSATRSSEPHWQDMGNYSTG